MRCGQTFITAFLTEQDFFKIQFNIYCVETEYLKCNWEMWINVDSSHVPIKRIRLFCCVNDLR